MFPPGLARLATSPRSTGSSTPTMTTGIELVAFLAARVAAVPGATMTSTGMRTNSAATADARSSFPSPPRYSIANVRPLTQPRAVITCSKIPRFSADEL